MQLGVSSYHQVRHLVGDAANSSAESNICGLDAVLDDVLAR